MCQKQNKSTYTKKKKSMQNTWLDEVRVHVQDKHKEPMNQGCPDLTNLQTTGAIGEEQPSCQGP